MERIDEILDFWFKGDTSRWFKKDPAFDAEVTERFQNDVARAQRGELDAWCDSPRGCLACVILIDQFSRNIHRGSAQAFAGDARAQAIVIDALVRGDDQRLGAHERLFLYMPLMHAEDLALQDRGLALFSAAANSESGEQAKLAANFADFGQKHRAIIARFGRFPHRNAVLGRESTAQEAEFLQQPGSSF